MRKGFGGATFGMAEYEWGEGNGGCLRENIVKSVFSWGQHGIGYKIELMMLLMQSIMGS